MKYLIDTNILIDHLRGDSNATELLQHIEEGSAQAAVSVITEYELLASAKLKESEIVKINSLLELIPRLAITSQTVRIAAKFHRDYRTDLADALIAATAFLAKATLVTRNIKHFNNIRELHTQNLPF
jgi:predicted nucleic acid-binding protein